MSIFSYFTPAHFARFVAAVRQDGWRSALIRTRYYLSLAISGGGRSALAPATKPGTPRPGPRYLDAFWRDMAEAEAFQAASPAPLTKRRKVAMIADLNLPQCRKYRVEQMAGFWAAHDVDYAFAGIHDVPRAVALMQDATHLTIYRTANRPQMSMYLYEARRLRLPVAYDIDDPLFSVPAYATYGNMAALPPGLQAHFLAEAPGYLDAMNLADIVTVSTPGLAGHATAMTPRPVYLRRNFADAATLSTGRAAQGGAGRRDGPFRVVFASGSQGHEADLRTIADDLAAFMAAAPGRELMILGQVDTGLLPEPLRAHARLRPFADYDAYLLRLAHADCAVMPLTDDLFNRCKSGVRVIDAAAVAVPSLVPPVGDLATLVRDGVTGHVIGPGESWRDRLEMLAADRAATHAMGRTAQDDLHLRWSDPAAPGIADPALAAWVKA